MDHVKKKDRPFALKALYQMAQALDYIHSQGIIHCDLSPLNILVDEDGQLALTDFGCAHLSSSSAAYPDASEEEEIGTRYGVFVVSAPTILVKTKCEFRYYKAPEHLFGYRIYQPATDLWSLGTIFYELLTGYIAFDGQNDLEQIGAIVRSLGVPSDKVKNEVTRSLFFRIYV